MSEELLTGHNHKANFGRIVAGCPRCMEIVVERGTANPAVTTAGTAEGTTYVTTDAPTAIGEVATSGYAQVVNPPQAPAGVMTMEQVLLLIEKLREPDEETKRKREEERLLKARRDAEMLELAKTEMEQRKFRESNCGTGHGPHTKDNGKSAIQGQIHSDGMFHGICVRCGFQPEPYAPPVGTMVGGLQ